MKDMRGTISQARIFKKVFLPGRKDHSARTESSLFLLNPDKSNSSVTLICPYILNNKLFACFFKVTNNIFNSLLILYCNQMNVKAFIPTQLLAC